MRCLNAAEITSNTLERTKRIPEIRLGRIILRKAKVKVVGEYEWATSTNDYSQEHIKNGPRIHLPMDSLHLQTSEGQYEVIRSRDVLPIGYGSDVTISVWPIGDDRSVTSRPLIKFFGPIDRLPGGVPIPIRITTPDADKPDAVIDKFRTLLTSNRSIVVPRNEDGFIQPFKYIPMLNSEPCSSCVEQGYFEPIIKEGEHQRTEQGFLAYRSIAA